MRHCQPSDRSACFELSTNKCLRMRIRVCVCVCGDHSCSCTRNVNIYTSNDHANQTSVYNRAANQPVIIMSSLYFRFLLACCVLSPFHHSLLHITCLPCCFYALDELSRFYPVHLYISALLFYKISLRNSTSIIIQDNATISEYIFLNRITIAFNWHTTWTIKSKFLYGN